MAVKTFLFLIFAVAFSGVAAWTVDLPEVQKYVFQKHEIDKELENQQNDEKTLDDIKAEGDVASQEKDSKTNHVYDFLKNHSDDENDVYNSGKYAGDFGYQSYREKEVHSIVRDGSVYLEGLRRAIEQYAERLRECEANERRNNRESQTLNTKPTNNMKTKTKWLPENERPITSPEIVDCERIKGSSEHVRRLAELALWATKELQERAYNDKYEGPPSEEQERELLLRLAWFLDRLAQLTGFKPQPHLLAGAPATTTTTTPAPSTEVPSSQEIVEYLLKCMKKSHSQEPVPERCRYPLTLPESVKRIFNATDAPPSATQINNQYPNDIVYLMQQSHREILEPQETKHAVEKRSVSDIAHNPSLYFMKYYVKHKVWETDNPISPTVGNKEFEIQNHLTDEAVKTVQRRSIDNKKSIHFRLPENPMQDISYYVKQKGGIRFVKDEAQALKFRRYLDKIRNSNRSTAKVNARKLEKSLQRPRKSFEKRSVR